MNTVEKYNMETYRQAGGFYVDFIELNTCGNYLLFSDSEGEKVTENTHDFAIGVYDAKQQKNGCDVCLYYFESDDIEAIETQIDAVLTLWGNA